MKQYSISQKLWQIGKTKVFLRGAAHEPLEDSRIKIVNAKAVFLQRIWRGYVVRRGINYLFIIYIILYFGF